MGVEMRRTKWQFADRGTKFSSPTMGSVSFSTINILYLLKALPKMERLVIKTQ